MLTVAKMGGGREQYYTHLAKEDYYVGRDLNALEPDGYWAGKGTERIGLQGQKVESETFKNVFRGYSPDGQEKWVYNAGQMGKNARDRMPGFDMTFGLPKSVSIAAVIGSDETRAAILNAANRAIETTLERIGEKCIVRSGKAGCIRERADLIASVFQHATARQIDAQTPPDPHIHFHITVINTGITASGKKGALQGQNFLNKEFAKEYGAMLRADFAQEMKAAGFALERKGESFELKGVNPELITALSKRATQIAKKAPREESTAKQKLEANLKTRQKKTEQNLDKLRLHWKKEALTYGVTPKVIDRLRTSPVTRTEPERQAEARYSVKEAARELSDERGAFTRAELQRRTLQASTEWGLSTRETEQAVGAYLKGLDAAKLKEPEKLEKLETKEQAAQGQGKQAAAPTQPKYAPAKKLAEAQAREAARQQRAQAREKERAEGLRMLKQEYERKGFKVIGAAHSQAQAEKMNKAGLKTFTMLRLVRDTWAEEKRNKNEAQGKRNLTLLQKITLTPNPSQQQRRAYGAWKQATWQWDKKTAQKYAGDYWQPTNEKHHNFLYATRQISLKQRDELNQQLALQERTIDGKTIVLIDAKTVFGRTFQRLKTCVQALGGQVVVKDALTHRTEKQHEQEQFAQEQRESKQNAHERQAAQERQRTRSR